MLRELIIVVLVITIGLALIGAFAYRVLPLLFAPIF
jgi:hypothetical protein